MIRRLPCVAIGISLLAVQAFAAPPVLSLDPSGADAPLPREGASKPLVSRSEGHAFRLTFYIENDGSFLKINGPTDRHYTAGVGAALAWQAPCVNDLLRNVPSFFDEMSKSPDNGVPGYAMGIVGALTMFTPEHIEKPEPLFDDRPYAGWTYGGIFFQRSINRDNPGAPRRFSSYESLELDVGIMGPSSLAENAQTLVHHTFGFQNPMGWDNQIHDEPEFSIKYNRRWASPKYVLIPMGQESGIAAQFIPEAGITVGSLIDEAHLGALVRVGWNLPDDFGPGNLANPADFTGRQPRGGSSGHGMLGNFFANQSFYVFVRPYGQLVAHNALLQGDNFRNDDPVTATLCPAVFGVEGGFAYRLCKNLEFTYTQTHESPTFKGQRGWDSWGSMQLAFFFAW